MAVIEKFVLPELTRWLRDRAAANQPVTEADFLVKLHETTESGLVKQLAFMKDTEGQA
jgi:hypothetical protein